MQIREIIHREPVTITETQSVKEALSLMNIHKVSALVVVDDNHHVKGILAIQDIVDAIVPSQMKENVHLAKAMHVSGYFEEQMKGLGDICVACVMRNQFRTTTPDASVMELASEFLHSDVGIVPVVEQEKLIGVVAQGEVQQVLANILNI